ncbi:hypothetical protein [Halalkalibacter okhensis]|uniref:Uncharacterized protein n=1 Tax=Halalkalibacter okhensis TaxID=333138 RepID=A0A0B0IDR9_9BACI|nr:hypothetical protein [Halalkalibacter okhensis]KHF40738.1 hypothetical protein LQ50_08115 [Halalkalibacter okhensis]
MIRRFSGQEIFIILTAIAVLLFMYTTIILSAPVHESIEDKELQSKQQVNLINESSLVFVTPIEKIDHE